MTNTGNAKVRRILYISFTGRNAMNIIWQSVKFNEADIVAIYTRGYSDGVEVNKKNKTIREWWCRKEDCPYESHVADGAYDMRRVK